MLEYAGNIFFLNSNKISSGQKSNKIVLNKEKKRENWTVIICWDIFVLDQRE